MANRAAEASRIKTPALPFPVIEPVKSIVELFRAVIGLPCPPDLTVLPVRISSPMPLFWSVSPSSVALDTAKKHNTAVSMFELMI